MVRKCIQVCFLSRKRRTLYSNLLVLGKMVFKQEDGCKWDQRGRGKNKEKDKKTNRNGKQTNEDKLESVKDGS